jgi:hypothetical protein
MSDKDLDKLFKTKLEDLQSSPGPAAWDKISSEIEGKKSGGIWWKAAAAVLLLLSVGMVIRWSLPVDDPQIAQTGIVEESATDDDAIRKAEESIASIEEKDVPAENEVLEPAPTEVINEPPVKDQTPSQENIAYSSTKEVSEENVAKATEEITAESRNAVAAISESPEDVQEVIEELPTEEEIYTSTAVAVTGSTRSFSIDQFASAQIDEEQIIEERTEEKNEKGIRKIFGLLQQVKEPDNGLGNLRSMKNELFARGKSKKERSNP